MIGTCAEGRKGGMGRGGGGLITCAIFQTLPRTHERDIAVMRSSATEDSPVKQRGSCHAAVDRSGKRRQEAGEMEEWANWRD